MGPLSPIMPDAPLLKALPSLSQKLLVDFANGIDVARDHIRVEKSRSGFFSRLVDGFTGAGARRAVAVHESLVDGVEGALESFVRLTESVEASNLAIVEVCDKVKELQRNTAILAARSKETSDLLESLSRRVDERFRFLSAEIQRVDLEQSAHRHLCQVMNKWEAGVFACFSPAGSLCAAMEELRWGDFGDMLRSSRVPERRRSDFLGDLRNRSLILLQKSVASTNLRYDAEMWIGEPRNVTALPGVEDAPEALEWLMDWTDPQKQPFAYATARHPSEYPLLFPRRFDGRRMTHALVEEILESEVVA